MKKRQLRRTTLGYHSWKCGQKVCSQTGWRMNLFCSAQKEMVHFFSFLFCPTFSVALYLQNAPAIPVCSKQPCVVEGKARIWMPLAASFIHGTRDMHERRLQPIGYREIEENRPSPKCLNICPNGGQKGLLTDRLTIKSNSWSLIEGVSAERGENGQNEVQ